MADIPSSRKYTSGTNTPSGRAAPLQPAPPPAPRPPPPAPTAPRPPPPPPAPRSNDWAGIALLSALLALVPALRLWAGLTAVLCGLLGRRRAQVLAGRGRWMASTAIGGGILLVVWSLTEMVPRPLQIIPPQLGTPPSGPRPPVQPPQRGTSGPPSLPVDSPVDVIRSYYADLHRRDGESAVGKWKDPNREKLLNLIKRIEWFQTQDVRLVRSDAYSAQVGVDVIGKNFNEKPKNWLGVIELEKVNNTWKIASMKDLREKR